MRKRSQNTRFVRMAEVTRRSGHSRTTIWRLQKRREFPPSYKISERNVAIREDDFNLWLNQEWVHTPPFCIIHAKSRAVGIARFINIPSPPKAILKPDGVVSGDLILVGQTFRSSPL
jgi:predicted DNA-binding transcriptional regulator AlpA